MATADQTLLDNDQRLRLALETGKIGLWIWNSSDQANSGDWSQRMKEIFGLPYDAAVTHDMFLKTVHPEDRQRIDQAVQDALSGRDGGNYSAVYRVLSPADGSLRWVTARGRAFFDESGVAIRFIGAVMDITENKRTELELNALNAQLELRIAERTADIARSERLARGQAESLTRALAALTRETDPERLLEHLLCTIAQQLQAQGLSIWYLDADSGLLVFKFAFEGKQIVTSSDLRIAAITPPMPIDSIPAWQKIFRTGTPQVIDDLRVAPSFPWRQRLIDQGVVTVLIVPLLIAGKAEGTIDIRFTEHRTFRPDELELAQALAHQGTLAMQLARLSALSRQMAVAAERNRMARDIHDTLAQGFTGVIMQLEAAQAALARGEPAAAAERMTSASSLARSGLGEARRSVQALRPSSLDNGTLSAALEELLRMTAGLGLQADFILEGAPRPIPASWEEGLLRIAQESLTNTIKHAQAQTFRATMHFGRTEVRLQLVDDGRGFDLNAENDGFGLIGMRERADQMLATFIQRSEPGKGTEIVVLLPCPNGTKP